MKRKLSDDDTAFIVTPDPPNKLLPHYLKRNVMLLCTYIPSWLHWWTCIMRICSSIGPVKLSMETAQFVAWLLGCKNNAKVMWPAIVYDVNNAILLPSWLFWLPSSCIGKIGSSIWFQYNFSSSLFWYKFYSFRKCRYMRLLADTTAMHYRLCCMTSHSSFCRQFKYGAIIVYCRHA